MTDDDKSKNPMISKDAEVTAKITYILYILGFWTIAAPVVGLVLAYINVNEGPAWLRSHFTYQVRTFWIAALFFSISYIFLIIAIGFLGMILTYIWVVIRCAKAFKKLNKHQGIEDVQSWSWN